jgi:transposase
MEKYIVTLSPEEVEQLRSLVGKGKHAAQKVINALILLNCDQSQGRDDRRTSQEIAAVLQVSERKIDRVKRRFVEEGLEAALGGQPSQREYVSKVDGEVEAHLIALSCSAPPSGYARWSLRLLADRAVELELVQEISHETVRRVLKKTNSSRGKRWVG